MKYRFILIVLAVLLLFSAAGCGRKAGGEQARGEQTSGGQKAGGPAESSLPDLSELPMPKEGWPQDSVPPELPEYTGGKVVNSGGDDVGFYIKIRETDKEAMDKYLQGLKDAGWTVTGDSNEAEAIKGLYTVEFEWQDGGSLLQMSLRTGEAGSWPSDEIPSDVLQPQTGTLVGGVEVLQSVENMWYFNYTYDGIDEAAAQQYIEMLKEKGWNGDMQLSKSFEWKGKKYEATIEIYETVETRTTFTCNFYIAD